MPDRGAYFHWGGALFVEGHPKKAFWFFHCLKLSIYWRLAALVVERLSVSALVFRDGYYRAWEAPPEDCS
jgi:hypothetical protein